MLRVLFIILAVVAITLAVVLQQPLLYVVAVVLLLAAGLLLSAKLRRQHRDVPESFMQAPVQPEEDLSQLGILEIKPVEKTKGNEITSDAGSDEPGDAEGEDRSGPEDEAEGAGVEASERSSDTARTRKPRAHIMVSEASGKQNADVMIPALRSLRAGLDAYTVCLLRQEESPLRYHIEAIVSQNSYARSRGSFSAKEPLLAGHRALVPVVYPRVGPEGFPKQKLGYYHEPISVRQVAMVPVAPKKEKADYLLVVDTVNDGGLESAPVRVLLEQFARLFGTILDTAAEGGLASPGDPDDIKPRREIISEEMDRARSMSHPLALALVFLNRDADEDSEGLVSDEELSEMEARFEVRLREIVKDGRIERFGELTFGVFYHGASEDVARWAGRIQSSFEGQAGDLGGGVNVGAVVMSERHEGPDELRSDATAALQEAFQTGECTVVE